MKYEHSNIQPDIKNLLKASHFIFRFSFRFKKNINFDVYLYKLLMCYLLNLGIG